MIPRLRPRRPPGGRSRAGARIADAAGDTAVHGGLTDFGREVLREVAEAASRLRGKEPPRVERLPRRGASFREAGDGGGG